MAVATARHGMGAFPAIAIDIDGVGKSRAKLLLAITRHFPEAVTPTRAAWLRRQQESCPAWLAETSMLAERTKQRGRCPTLMIEHSRMWGALSAAVWPVS